MARRNTFGKAYKFGKIAIETIYAALDEDGDVIGRWTFGHCPDDGFWHVWDASDPSAQTLARYPSRAEAAKRARAEAEDLITIRER